MHVLKANDKWKRGEWCHFDNFLGALGGGIV